MIDADGNDVGIGEEGEEISRGPNVFVGYTTGMHATNCAIDEDGWFQHSGEDLCIKNEGSFLNYRPLKRYHYSGRRESQRQSIG